MAEARSDDMGVRTIIVQCWFGGPAPAWIERCLGSVTAWAAASGTRYLRIGDTLFDPVPGWVFDAATGARLALVDYARLLWIERLLAEGDRIVWLDADVLVLDPARIEFPAAPFALGRERWIWCEEGVIRAEERITPAAMVFTREGGLLAWYRAACETILRDAPRPLNRTALGPQLLTALAAARRIPLVESIATLSPALIDDVLTGGGPALADHRAHWHPRIAAAHLCHSLGGTQDAPDLIAPGVHDAVVERLLADGTTLLNEAH